MNTPRLFVGFVVGSLCLCMLIYVGTLAALVMQKSSDIKALEYFKDAGLIIIGAVGGILAKTSSNDGHPVQTEITNTSANPVPTHDQQP